jgi:hypothetical protein
MSTLTSEPIYVPCAVFCGSQLPGHACLLSLRTEPPLLTSGHLLPHLKTETSPFFPLLRSPHFTLRYWDYVTNITKAMTVS